MPDTHRIVPGAEVDLSKISPEGKDYHSHKKAARKEFKTLRREIIELQNRLYAECRQRLLIVFQAMDAGGKDGTIRSVFRGVNPQGCRVASFKAPTRDELHHDFLWRIHAQTPASGMMQVFNRSHYEDVLVVRVDKLAPEPVWRARYEQINQFEKLLADSGTRILKFYLHISKDEQKARFQERLDDPAKHWKFSLGDLEKRKQWGEYRAAYEEAISRCSTAYAPWYVIPANQNWYRDLAVTRVIVDRLKQMNPQYPPEEPGLDLVEVE
ncbi:MAG: polyphosphate kinase 2 family protein [Planctomycetales bacterium]|nr:polyphosphate kinase 2 family protein [Planctomycetales bacterium]MCA9169294.1 polyphosphate kinase 2 family protein [Planctomycetales bacterium]